MSGIKLIDIHKQYLVEDKNLQVLNGINLEIPENEITVILGQSGCGKTTLLRVVGELESYQSGHILKESSKLAFVFQEPRLMPWLNVTQNIIFGMQKTAVSNQDVKLIINFIGLTGFEKAYPHQLSGGMQQRVSIARALMCNPSFILMDEPFAALDYFTREQMQKELINVQNQNSCGILFVTHSIDEALLVAHKIVILEKGKVKTNYFISSSNKDRNLLDDEFINIKKNIIKNLNVV